MKVVTEIPIKIFKTGYSSEYSWQPAKQFECWNCGCKFDTTAYYFSENANDVTVICPWCGRIIINGGIKSNGAQT